MTQLYSKDNLRPYNINSLDEALSIRENGDQPVLSLNIADSKDITIPKGVFHFENLQKLTLNFCSYTSIPDQIEELQDLQFLHTLMTPIQTISSKIGTLPYLKELAIVNAELMVLPNTWNNNSKLRFINLRNNEIVKIPKSFNNLKSLEHLDLSSNQIKEIININNLTQLQLLNLSNNQISELNDNSFEGLDNLSTLNLGANPLTHLPKSVTELTKLEYLILADTEISTLPEGMDKLKQLKEIDFSYCKNIDPATFEIWKSQLPNTQFIFN